MKKWYEIAIVSGLAAHATTIHTVLHAFCSGDGVSRRFSAKVSAQQQ